MDLKEQSLILHVLRSLIMKYFRHSEMADYFEGLDMATNTLMSLASGEFTAEDYGKSVKKVQVKDSQDL